MQVRPSLPVPMAGRSLAARLILAATVWGLIVLVAGGWGLSSQYRASALRQLDRDLAVVIDALAATVDTEPDGSLSIAEQPNDPRFVTTFSGRYWQVSSDGVALARSASLWDEVIAWRGPKPAPGPVVYAHATGPKGQRLRIAAVTLAAPQREAPLTFLAAADMSAAEADAQAFSRALYLALAALAAGLVAAVVIQVRVGLAPLDALRRDVAAIRRGVRDRLAGPYPVEVETLTGELNKLLDHNREVVERARTQVGNLAHALKTPISVLLNEARAGSGPLATVVARQAAAMDASISRYLARAQAAARAETLGSRTPVEPPLADIVRTLERLYGRNRDMDLTLRVTPGDLAFRGERQDLEEMAGNLVENACKYGGGTVLVTAAPAEHGLDIVVEDDGAGLHPDQRDAVLKRGARLDETAPGQGLGLAIVADLAALYGGRLALEESDLGGLRARLTLPLAD